MGITMTLEAIKRTDQADPPNQWIFQSNEPVLVQFSHRPGNINEILQLQTLQRTIRFYFSPKPMWNCRWNRRLSQTAMIQRNKPQIQTKHCPIKWRLMAIRKKPVRDEFHFFSVVCTKCTSGCCVVQIVVHIKSTKRMNWWTTVPKKGAMDGEDMYIRLFERWALCIWCWWGHCLWFAGLNYGPTPKNCQISPSMVFRRAFRWKQPQLRKMPTFREHFAHQTGDVRLRAHNSSIPRRPNYE